MTTTRDVIIQLADDLVRDKGFNAFSFHDIAKTIGIKTASIHYHFPTKTDLGIAIIKEQTKRFEQYKIAYEKEDPAKKLEAFFSIYSRIKSENKVCLVGSLSTDLNTMDEAIKKELKVFSEKVLDWVTQILKEGKSKKIFSFNSTPRTKALMIITNMLAIVQLSRLTSEEDLMLVQKAILKEIKN